LFNHYQIQADRVNITTGGSITLQQTNITGNPAVNQPALLQQGALVQPEVYLYTSNGLIQFQQAVVTCQTLYVGSDANQSFIVPGAITGIEVISSVLTAKTTPVATITYPSLQLVSSSDIVFDGMNQVGFH